MFGVSADPTKSRITLAFLGKNAFGHPHLARYISVGLAQFVAIIRWRKSLFDITKLGATYTLTVKLAGEEAWFSYSPRGQLKWLNLSAR